MQLEIVWVYPVIDVFDQRLASRLKRWFMCLPAGIGMATLKSCFKLCLGFSPACSGSYSAGNGPLMRAALLGLLFGNCPDSLKTSIWHTTRITHTDPKGMV